MVLKENENIYGINYTPKCLTAEEEKKYIELLEKGDIEAREKLIEGNLRLVWYITKNFRNTEIEITELNSVGTIGLIYAVDTFKSAKNIKMSTYACVCIRNEINKYFVYNSRHPNYNAENFEIFDQIICNSAKYEYEKYENMEIIAKIMEDILNNLKYKEKVCMLYYLGGIKTPEISRRFGVSKTYICRILRQARKDLKLLALNRNERYKRFSVQVQDELYKVSIKINEQQIYSDVQQIISKSRYMTSNKNSEQEIEIYVDLEDEKVFGLLAEIVQCIEKNSKIFDED